MANRQLTESQKKLLALIASKNGELNWYKIGRVHMHLFESPGDFDECMLVLKQSHLIEERAAEGEALPRLFVTQKGSAQLLIS